MFRITIEEFNFESMILDYIDEFKFLFFPDKWSNVFLDYSKNEILVLLYLYKKKTANMTELSEYICSPLNTATGVIGRLEKKKMIARVRGDQDRRVVNIELTRAAEEFLDQEKKLLEYYLTEVYKALTAEEKKAFISIAAKVVSVLKKDRDEGPARKVKRITIE